MGQVSQFYRSRDRIVFEFCHVIQIRYIIFVSHQRHRFQNVSPETFGSKIFQCVIRVFHHVMQQRNDCSRFICHLFRHMGRMKNIRQPALVHLTLVCFIAKFHGFFGFVCVDHMVFLLYFSIKL